MQTVLRPKPESQPGLMHAQTASARFSTAPPLWAFLSVDRFLNLLVDSRTALNAGLRRQGLQRLSSCSKAKPQLLCGFFLKKNHAARRANATY
jgi:hypothetical protein